MLHVLQTGDRDAMLASAAHTLHDVILNGDTADAVAAASAASEAMPRLFDLLQHGSQAVKDAAGQPVGALATLQGRRPDVFASMAVQLPGSGGVFGLGPQGSAPRPVAHSLDSPGVPVWHCQDTAVHAPVASRGRLSEPEPGSRRRGRARPFRGRAAAGCPPSACCLRGNSTAVPCCRGPAPATSPTAGVR